MKNKKSAAFKLGQHFFNKRSKLNRVINYSSFIGYQRKIKIADYWMFFNNESE